MWSYNYSSAELYHHGIVDMKWGVRRYQNKDGSLTPLGKSRRRKTTSNATTKKQTQKQSAEPEQKMKSVKDMSDEELSAATKRLRAENDYLNASKTHSELSPKKVSAGQKFVSTVANKVVAPAATNASKQLLQEWLETEGRKALGLPAKSNDKKKKKKG